MGSAVTRVRYIYEGKKYPQRFFKEDENIPGQGELATKLFHEFCQIFNEILGYVNKIRS